MPYTLSTYQPSGKIGSKAFVLAIAGLFFAIPTLSLAYAYLLFYIPYYLVNLITWLAACYALTRILKQVYKPGKVRNKRFSFWLAMLLCSSFYYLHWAAWLHLILENNPNFSDFTELISQDSGIFSHFSLAASPGEMWQLAVEVRDLQFTGWLIWTIEFLGFLFVGWVYSSTTTTSPFSETDDEWHEEWSSPAVFSINPAELKKAVLEKDLSYFDNLKVIEKGRFDYSGINLFTSTSGPDYLTLITYGAKTKNNARTSYKETTNIELLEISKDISNKIKALGEVNPINQEELKAIIEIQEAKEQLRKEQVAKELQPVEAKDSIDQEKKSEATHRLIIPDKETIETPVLGIKRSQNNSAGNLFYSIFMLGAGILFLSLADDIMEQEFITVIGGLLFTVGGLVGTIMSIKALLAPTEQLMVRINPSFILIRKEISSTSINKKIPMNLLLDVRLHATDTSSSMKLIFKEPVDGKSDLISLDISALQIDRYEMKDYLLNFAHKPVEKRQELLKNWLRKRPSLAT